MMIYKLSGDVDELLGRPVGEVATVESVGDSIGVEPLNVVPIAEAFDESVTAEQLPIPWEQIDEVSEVVSEIDSEVVSSPEEAVIESSFCEMLPLLDPIPVGDTTTEATPADDTSPNSPAGPTNEQVIARKLQLCDLIQHVGDEIQAVDEEIAELSAGLKAAKKLRESKLERLQELSQELKNARRDLAEKQKAAATESDAGEVSDELDKEGDNADDESTSREEVEGTDSATDFDPDAYNPWDHWEQGRAITCVRLLVATEGMVAGTSCSVFDVEPPQVEGDSFSGDVTVYRLGSDRETVVLSKRECAPMLPGVKEPPIGHRIGVRPKKKVESATKRNQPEDDSWKTVPVSELDIPSSLVSILVEDNSIRTIGDIQEFTRWNRLTDLKKVGEAKAEKIDEALVEFWRKR